MTVAFSANLTTSSEPNNNLVFRQIVTLSAGGQPRVRFRSGVAGLTASIVHMGVSTGNGEMSGAVELNRSAGPVHGFTAPPNGEALVSSPHMFGAGDHVIEWAIPTGDGVNGGSFLYVPTDHPAVYWQGGALWDSAGPRDSAPNYVAVDQIEMLPAHPPFTPVVGGEMILDDVTVTVDDHAASIDLTNRTGIDYENYRIEIYSARAETNTPGVPPYPQQPPWAGYGGVLTMILATDPLGVIFDEGPHYTSEGIYGTGPGLPEGPPTGVGNWGKRVEVTEGFVLGADNVSAPENGWNGDVKIRCPGTVGGVPVNVSMQAMLSQDESYPIQGGRSCLVSYAAGWQIGSPGLRPRGFRLCCNREGVTAATIVGRARLIGKL